MREPLVVNPPNDAPSIERVWMWVSRDADGRENVCGYETPIGWVPLMTGNPRIFEGLKIIASALAERMGPTGKTIHLLEFTGRSEIGGWLEDATG